MEKVKTRIDATMLSLDKVRTHQLRARTTRCSRRMRRAARPRMAVELA